MFLRLTALSRHCRMSTFGLLCSWADFMGMFGEDDEKGKHPLLSLWDASLSLSLSLFPSELKSGVLNH